jgi:hypothetical protein
LALAIERLRDYDARALREYRGDRGPAFAESTKRKPTHEEGRSVMKTATLERMEHDFDDDEWDEEDDDLAGTDEEELDLDELDEEDSEEL